jgi:predicted RNA-binding protein with TRAM domain
LENRDSHTSGPSGSGGGYRSDRGYGGGYGGRGRGGFGGPRPFRPAPVKVGEEFDVKIESMSKRGDAGVAKVEGLVIFVADTKVGDNLRIRITKVGRGYATAEIASQSESTSAGTTTKVPSAELDEETTTTTKVPSAELDEETTSDEQ